VIARLRGLSPRQLRFALGAGSLVGRIVFRKRIARVRRQAMTGVAAATVGGLLVVALVAEYERQRDSS
jgi:hypothetical protein